MTVALLCSVAGCGRDVIARDYCTLHYQRWRKSGDPCASVPARGVALKWLIDVASAHGGDGCLIYPFRRRLDGYADLQVDRRKVLAHRIVCAEVHGPPPTPHAEAAHSCGKGHEGCVSGGHLRWDTRNGNMADKVAHGTHQRGVRSPNARLTEDDVREIRRLAPTISYRELGERFGVSKNTARQVATRQRWGWLA